MTKQEIKKLAAEVKRFEKQQALELKKQDKAEKRSWDKMIKMAIAKDAYIPA